VESSVVIIKLFAIPHLSSHLQLWYDRLCLGARSLIYLLSVLQLWNALLLAAVSAAQSSTVTVDYPTALAVASEYCNRLIITTFSWYLFMIIAASAVPELANVDHYNMQLLKSVFVMWYLTARIYNPILFSTSPMFQSSGNVREIDCAHDRQCELWCLRFLELFLCMIFWQNVLGIGMSRYPSLVHIFLVCLSPLLLYV